MLAPTADSQRTEQWFQDRLGMATGSRFGDVMARTPTPRKAYAAQVALERVTGRVEESFQSKDMLKGIELEDLARFMYMAKTGNIVEETGFLKHDTLKAGCSPDGLIGTDGGVEFKVPRLHNHLETLQTGRVPSKYIWQVVGGMFITGRKWWDFVSYSAEMPENCQLAIVRVERDDEQIAALEMELTEFEEEVQAIEQFIRGYSNAPS